MRVYKGDYKNLINKDPITLTIGNFDDGVSGFENNEMSTDYFYGI